VVLMTTFTIWCEGYAATGEHATANCLGTFEGANFAEACDKWANRSCTNPDLYDPDRLTYWGCQLFDNEAEARRSYG
jgi:hypothetical protein